jgi:hypothetical protein
MRIGAKIMLNVGLDDARDGLAGLADTNWMMSLPRKDPHPGHPAGRTRPGLPVAVTFGRMAVSAGSFVLPVRWESAEPGDQFTVLLDADITLAPDAEEGHSTLTLAGVCRLPPGTLTIDDYELARMQVIEAARESITSIADTVTHSAARGQKQPRGQAWSWLTGIPRQR